MFLQPAELHFHGALAGMRLPEFMYWKHNPYCDSIGRAFTGVSSQRFTVMNKLGASEKGTCVSYLSSCCDKTPDEASQGKKDYLSS